MTPQQYFKNNELAVLTLTLQRRKPCLVLQHLDLGLPPGEALEMRTLQEASRCPGSLITNTFVSGELPQTKIPGNVDGSQ